MVSQWFINRRIFRIVSPDGRHWAGTGEPRKRGPGRGADRDRHPIHERETRRKGWPQR